MTPTRREVDILMKRCQIGVRGKYAAADAHEIMAQCYGTLGALMLRVESLEAERRSSDYYKHKTRYTDHDSPPPFLAYWDKEEGEWFAVDD